MERIEITRNFEGGNIIVRDFREGTFYLSTDLRDTDGDWFYWAFCVKNAGGKKLKFEFDKDWVGRFGAAVSHDQFTWKWSLGERTNNSFMYQFKPDENEVYFAHNLLYTTQRFYRFAATENLKLENFCVSEFGTPVPWVCIGKGDKKILMTSRHHCCEATGTYVLQGIIEELKQKPIPGHAVVVVPFVDIDGVIKGDQGKNRVPHDHNRDYGKRPIYDTVKAIMQYGKENNVEYFFDFHAPKHQGGTQDYVFFIRKRVEDDSTDSLLEVLSSLLEKEMTDKSLKYTRNIHIPFHPVALSSSNYFYTLETVKLSTTFETPYFGLENNISTQESLIELGRCFARALTKLVQTA